MTEPEIIINVNTQRDGYIFGLRPRSRVWLETHYSTRERVSSVFIGLDSMADLRQIPETILRHVVSLVTGLSLDELNAIGGFRLYNPATGEEILNRSLAYV